MTQEKILLICNEPYSFEEYSTALEREGFSNVFTVKNAVEGLRMATEKTPDVILIDWSVGAENNYELLNAIREQGISARLVVLGASSPSSYDLNRFVQARVCDYTTQRMVTAKELADTIRRVLIPQDNSFTASVPITEKLLSRLRELEMLNQRLFEHPVNREHYSEYEPGDFVYFVEGRWMAFCCISKISKVKSNPRCTEYVLEIVRQPHKNEYFRPLLTLRKYFTVDRTPELSGVSGAWRFYQPKEFDHYYHHLHGDMVTWSEHIKSTIIILITILVVLFLVTGGCFFAVKLLFLSR